MSETTEQVLTKQEKLVIFASYPKAPIAIFDSGTPASDIIEGVDFTNQSVIAERVNWNPDIIKLVLKPVRKMSNEDALDIAKAFYLHKKDDMLKPIDGKMLAQSLFDNDTEMSANEFFFIINWLREHNYSTPAPFGKGHWAAGKSLYELDLAIEPLSI